MCKRNGAEIKRFVHSPKVKYLLFQQNVFFRVQGFLMDLCGNSSLKSRNMYYLTVIQINLLIRFGVHKIKGYICK